MDTDISILAVDDVAANLVAIDAALAQPGLTIVRANSGTEALEQLLRTEVALALIDVRMPRMDGFELAELMRGADRTRGIPIIFMTAASHDPKRMFRGYEAGAVDFLHKPVDAQVLRSKVGVFVELYSQRRRLAAQLEELRAALRLNEMFAAVLGHDLRNPLSTISLGAELLLRNPSAETATSVGKRTQASVKRMASMIEQLLDVARIRAGGVHLRMESADLCQVCRTILDELEGANAEARIDLSSSGNTAARFDVDRISQVVSNLVKNALQHGEAQAPISVTVDGSDPHVVKVCVCNQGAISADLMNTLFEPFQSGRASRAGLGLGLYIARQFVQAHDGKVEARSTSSGQIIFEVVIPRVPVDGGPRELRLAL